ncbi:MAG: M23 family metallopeptidase [Chloroflexota bacterium]
MGADRRTALTAVLAVSLLGVVPGSAPTIAAADVPSYYLPAPEGTALIVSQGNGHPTGRRANERYAFDFVAAGDTAARFPVAAARGGTVMAQRSGVRGGRCNDRASGPRPSCWLEVNYVLIDHGDGTSGLYWHLKRDEPMVRRGDVVSAGQVIGSAGSSGWTNEVGVQFQVQRTPTWDEWGSSGWFQTASLPLSFSDTSVLDLTADGVPQTDDVVVSGNATPLREPFRLRRRPFKLPALVPLEIGQERDISSAYDADSPDGYGLHIAPRVVMPQVAEAGEAPQGEGGGASPDPLATVEPSLTDPGTAVRPLFGGDLLFAGCATGNSASLGRTVIIRQSIDDVDYLAVLGHLSDIDPTLLHADPAIPMQVGPNDVLGHYGVILAPDEVPALTCPGAETGDTDLFAGILRDASVSAEGEISGGTPLSLEPLFGRGGYEGFAGWAGPVRAVSVAEEPGRPRVNWNRKTPAHSTRIPYGQSVTLAVRVRDRVDIQEVRFKAYYPRWPRIRSSQAFDSFDPRQTWRQVAVCRPPGVRGAPRRTRGCTWNGDATDAVVSFEWDPTVTTTEPAAPWLPRDRTAIGPRIEECVAVSLAVEVVDTAGHVRSSVDGPPTPARCDQRGVDRSETARVVYLDPFVPPRAPATRGSVEDRGWPSLIEPDPLAGAIVWRDRSNNEDGFRIYARRSWLQVDCSITNGRWRLIETLDPGVKRYRPRHNKVVRSIPVPDIPDVPGRLTRWEYAVSSFNAAGESKLIPVGGFIGGGDAFCGTLLEPPPEL